MHLLPFLIPEQVSAFSIRAELRRHPAPWTELVFYPSSMQMAIVGLSDPHCVSQPNKSPFIICMHQRTRINTVPQQLINPSFQLLWDHEPNSPEQYQIVVEAYLLLIFYKQLKGETKLDYQTCLCMNRGVSPGSGSQVSTEIPTMSIFFFTTPQAFRTLPDMQML